jgi:serine/threonine-protein kinase
MTPERWRQVTRVYGAVLTKPPAARAAALAELCPDDEALRKEVESLLADDSGALLDRPLGDVASSLADQNLSGRTLGPYRLESAIGAGGMGQVYRANDTRLHRTVAIKVLAPSLAHDSQFRARFDREAKAIAALNHPYICTLHDIGSSDGIDYLVMEYVDGETLSTRLERGALSFEQALTTAIQIAEALAAAHRQGIVHRDLKPGNVMLTKAGVKLLDFGLAKPSQTVTMAGPLSMLPTTPPMASTRGAPLTVQGTILGTLQYMAPEQLEGKEADARTDIFAFGAIVYEMVTGKRAFSGTSQASLIGAIMHAEPQPMSAEQPLTPASLERVVKTCLAKWPDDRWQTAHDLARELRWIATGSEQTAAATPARSQSTLPWAIAATAIVMAAAFALLTTLRPDHSVVADNTITRFSIANTGATATWFGTVGNSIAISPDGSKVVYLGANGSQLLMRSMDHLEPIVIATGALRSPVVSADGRWVGFVDGFTFKRVASTGGAPVPIASLQAFGGSRGATWTLDNTLIFATNNTDTGLLRLPALASDGVPEVLTRPDPRKGEADHVWPSALPDGSGVLFTITAQTGGLDAAQIAFLDTRTGTISTLLHHGSQPRYVASGHLVYAARGTLFAVPFDLKRHQVTGAEVSVIEGIRTLGNGAADYALADQGTVAFVAGSVAAGFGQPRTLVWVDRSGNEKPLGSDIRTFQDPRISPNGSRIAVSCADQEQDIWIWENGSQHPGRFTSETSVEESPLWTPDGKQIIYSSDRGPNYGIFNLWSQPADDPTQPAKRLTVDNANAQFPDSFSPKGDWLFYRQTGADQGRHMFKISFPTSGSATPVLNTSVRMRNGELSPDGRWFAFESDNSGTWEIYLRSFETGGAQLQVTTGGGRQPHWSKNGRDLFFFGGDGAFMKAEASGVSGLRASSPVKILPAGYFTGSLTGRFDGRQYDVSADGQRFLMIKARGDLTPPSITIEQHFDEELKTRVPSK